ncbi:MAG: type I-C CRISPR-associated protein Cas8c/Csd1 [Verrucomicrobiota bacterium]
MILQALNDLYGRLAQDLSYRIAPPGFSPQKISFRIVIREDGSFLPPEDARTPNENGKLQTTIMEVPGGAKPPGAGVNPCFLWDNQTYLLGHQPEEKKEGFGLERFEAFRSRHLELEKEIDCPEYSAVCRFLEKWNPDDIDQYPILNEVGTGFGVFQILGQKGDVHNTPKILDWWNANQPKETTDVIGQCLITGEPDVAIARLHPKIKGITGAQSAGASIVSFNDTAYESYGKSQSYNSPVSQDTAFRYGSALNALLTGPKSKKHRLRIGDTTCVFWTEQASEVEDIFAEILGGGSNATEETQDETQRARIERFLKALRSGGAFVDDQAPLDTPFYLLGLAPNAARISIRFFHRSTINELLGKLRDHQRCLSIVREFEESKGKRLPDPEFPAIWQLLNQTARVSDEIPPLLGGALTRSIVEGSPYPEGLFTAVIRRIHADRTINYLRAAIIKAVLTRNSNHSITITHMLDTSDNTEHAYKLGRLFAVIEKIQEDALGALNSGLRDKYYSSASATPANVFPILLRNCQNHLTKIPSGKLAEIIGKEKATKAKAGREILLQEILDGIESSGFEPQLNIKSQGIFAIGYYHQRKAFFPKQEQPETPPTK